ncbi:MAG: ABC transporter ATP-binding protein [Candidatus Anstonellales archaeon]
MAITNEVIRLENVWKTYEAGSTNLHAVRGISMQVNQGDYIAIVGPSGSGKSTLMHILGLLDTPTNGKVYIDGVETTTLSDENLSSIRAKKIGFVFQSFYLIPSLNAIQNVELPAMLVGVPKKERMRRAERILSSFSLSNRLFHLPSELSGGERQRVAIARALINDPSIILADEPTGNLDSSAGREVLKIFDGLNKKGKTIIIVTHDTSVASHSNEILYIRDGSIEKRVKIKKESQAHIRQEA